MQALLCHKEPARAFKDPTDLWNKIAQRPTGHFLHYTGSVWHKGAYDIMKLSTNESPDWFDLDQ